MGLRGRICGRRKYNKLDVIRGCRCEGRMRVARVSRRIEEHDAIKYDHPSTNPTATVRYGFMISILFTLTRLESLVGHL
jgi:hypothetical protein